MCWAETSPPEISAGTVSRTSSWPEWRLHRHKNRAPIQGVVKAHATEMVCLQVFSLFKWNHTLQHTQPGCLPAPCRKPIRQHCGQDGSGRCNSPSAQPSGDHPSSGYSRNAKASLFFHWHKREFLTTLSKSLSTSLPKGLIDETRSRALNQTRETGAQHLAEFWVFTAKGCDTAARK